LKCRNGTLESGLNDRSRPGNCLDLPEERSASERPVKEAPMSMTDLDLFPSESDSMREPQFSTARNGYNPREVDGFVGKLADQIETLKGQVQRLERGLRQAQAESESTRQRYAAAKAEVYEEFAARMAELLRTADMQADKVRREADEVTAKQLADAQQQADRTIREATMEAEHLKWEGQEALKRARAEAEKVVQEITVFRRSVRGELQHLHDRLVTVVEELGATIETPEPEPGTIPSLTKTEEPRAEAAEVMEAARPVEPTAEVVPDLPQPDAAGSHQGETTGGPEAHEAHEAHEATQETRLTVSPERTEQMPPAPQPSPAQGADAPQGGTAAEERAEETEADDLLSTVQGFDLVLPEFGDEPDQE
jgi:DivIVA domain-containing protein